MRTVPRAMYLPRARAVVRGGPVLHGQEHAEDGAGRLAVAFDDAAVVVDDLGDEREAEPGSVGLGGDEGIEQMLLQVIGDARTVVLDLYHQREADARVRALHRHADTRPKRGLHDDAALLLVLADGFR